MLCKSAIGSYIYECATRDQNHDVDVVSSTTTLSQNMGLYDIVVHTYRNSKWSRGRRQKGVSSNQLNFRAEKKAARFLFCNCQRPGWAGFKTKQKRQDRSSNKSYLVVLDIISIEFAFFL